MKKTRTSAPEQHVGLIATVVLHYWKHLPMHVQTWYSVDDMIGDCLLQVLRVHGEYQSKRGKTSTFIYAVSRNRCREIVASFNQLKRNAITFSIDALQEQYGTQVPSKSVPATKVITTRETLELLLEMSGDDLRRVLTTILQGNKVSIHDARRVAAEARGLMQRYHLSFSDVLAFDKLL